MCDEFDEGDTVRDARQEPHEQHDPTGGWWRRESEKGSTSTSCVGRKCAWSSMMKGTEDGAHPPQPMEADVGSGCDGTGSQGEWRR
jgi:hypothetical protein